MKTKSLALTGLTILLASTLVACSGGNESSSKSSEKPKDVSTKTVKKKAKSSNEIPTDDKHEWFFKNDVFYAGMETYKLTKSEIRDGIDGTKVLVIYTDITNNSKKEQDPSNVYMVVHAKQKTDTSNVDLNVGVLASDDEGNSPLQEYEDNLNNSLLPGKTVTGVLEFEIGKDNTNPVTVEFENSDFDKIGTKTYQVN